MILEVDSIYFEREGRKILSDIHLKMENRGVLGILGRNGSGKSSLFRVMFNQVNPQHYNFRIDGQYQASLYDKGLLQYLPQDGFLPAGEKIGHVIRLFIKEEADRQKVQEVLQENPDSPVNSLSFGKVRLLETLLLLFSKAPFVILDEPFTGLAPVIVESMCTMIKTQSQRKGIILTDHLHKEVLRISDRLLFMNQGCLSPIRDEAHLESLGYFTST